MSGIKFMGKDPNGLAKALSVIVDDAGNGILKTVDVAPAAYDEVSDRIRVQTEVGNQLKYVHHKYTLTDTSRFYVGENIKTRHSTGFIPYNKNGDEVAIYVSHKTTGSVVDVTISFFMDVVPTSVADIDTARWFALANVAVAANTPKWLLSSEIPELKYPIRGIAVTIQRTSGTLPTEVEVYIGGGKV